MRNNRVLPITIIAYLAALSFLFYYLKFPLPFIFPVFLDIQLSNLPAIIGGFALGPIAGATIVAPLGTLLTRGVVFAIDDADATQYPFSWCTRPGCFSRFGLTDLLVANMKAGTDVNITLFLVGDAQQPVAISASLKGFTAAFDALGNQAQ